MLACAGINGVVIFDIANNTYAEIGRIDSQRSVDAIAFSPDSQRLFIARERQPLIRYGDGGLDKLFDPFMVAIVGAVRDGTAPAFKLDPKKGANSLTGGSDIETWQLRRRSQQPDAKAWDAVVASFNDKPDEARQILAQVIKSYPKYGEGQRLNALFSEGRDPNKMRSSLESAVKADPGCITCWRSLGDLQMKTDHPADALTSYERVLQLKPEYGLVSGHMAEAYGRIALDLLASENTAKNHGRCPRSVE